MTKGTKYKKMLYSTTIKTCQLIKLLIIYGLILIYNGVSHNLSKY